jgi:hypothetical protein
MHGVSGLTAGGRRDFQDNEKSVPTTLPATDATTSS